MLDKSGDHIKVSHNEHTVLTKACQKDEVQSVSRQRLAVQRHLPSTCPNYQRIGIMCLISARLAIFTTPSLIVHNIHIPTETQRLHSFSSTYNRYGADCRRASKENSRLLIICAATTAAHTTHQGLLGFLVLADLLRRVWPANGVPCAGSVSSFGRICAA